MSTKRVRNRYKTQFIVDEVKSISNEEMKNQLSDTRDITTTLNLAPPTKQLMYWKERSGVEKLFELPGQAIISKILYPRYTRHLTTQRINEDTDVEVPCPDTEVGQTSKRCRFSIEEPEQPKLLPEMIPSQIQQPVAEPSVVSETIAKNLTTKQEAEVPMAKSVENAFPNTSFMEKRHKESPGISIKRTTDDDDTTKENCTNEPSKKDVDHRSTRSLTIFNDSDFSIIPKRIKFHCLYVRIGCREGYPINDEPYIPIFLDDVGFFFTILTKSQAVISDRVYVTLLNQEIHHIDCYFDNCWAQYMFLHITPKMSSKLQDQCKKFKVEDPVFGFWGTDVKVVTFLLDEFSPTEITDLLLYLKHLFPREGVINEKLTWQEVDKILLDPCSCAVYAPLKQNKWFQRSSAYRIFKNKIAERNASIDYQASIQSSKLSSSEFKCMHVTVGHLTLFHVHRNQCIILSLTPECLSFTTPNDQNDPIILKCSEIKHVAFYFGHFSYLFIRASTDYAKKIGFHLLKIDPTSSYSVSAAELEMQHRMIVYLGNLTEEQIAFMRKAFDNFKIQSKEIEDISSVDLVLEKFLEWPSGKEFQIEQKITNNPDLPLSKNLNTGAQCVGIVPSSERNLCKKDHSKNHVSVFGDLKDSSYLVNDQSIRHVKVNHEKDANVLNFQNTCDIDIKPDIISLDSSIERSVLEHCTSTTVKENVESDFEATVNKVKKDTLEEHKLIVKSDVEEAVDSDMFSVEDNMEFVESNVNIAAHSGCFIPEFYSPTENIAPHVGSNMDEPLVVEEMCNNTINDIVIKMEKETRSSFNAQKSLPIEGSSITKNINDIVVEMEGQPLSSYNTRKRFYGGKPSIGNIVVKSDNGPLFNFNAEKRFCGKELNIDNSVGGIVKKESKVSCDLEAEQNLHPTLPSINNNIDNIVKVESESLSSFDVGESLLREGPSTLSWLRKTHSKLKSQKEKEFVSSLPHIKL